MMEKTITLFTSNDVAIGRANGSFSCLIHCTGTYSDLINTGRQFCVFFRKYMKEDVWEMYERLSITDLKILKDFIVYAKNILTFHVDVKEISYYYFICFWNNVLFKKLKVEDGLLWYEMINDIYSKIKRNDFISFVSKIGTPYLQSRDNSYKKVIENICSQVQTSNVCTTTVKEYSKIFVPNNQNSAAYVLKQLRLYTYRRAEVERKIHFVREETLKLADKEITNKIYVAEPPSFSHIFHTILDNNIEMVIADSSFDEITNMLKFWCNMISGLLHKLECSNIEESERRKIMCIIYCIFNLFEFDNLEINVNDRIYNQLLEFTPQ